MAHVALTQSRPEPGLDFQVKVLKTIREVPSSLGSGPRHSRHAQDVVGGTAKNKMKTKHASIQGQNLSLTGLIVPSFFDTGTDL